MNCHLYVKLRFYVNLCFQGKVAGSAVLSNLYAMGVTECDNVLMHVGVPQKMTDKERNVVLPLLTTGFKVL